MNGARCHQRLFVYIKLAALWKMSLVCRRRGGASLARRPPPNTASQSASLLPPPSQVLPYSIVIFTMSHSNAAAVKSQTSMLLEAITLRQQSAYSYCFSLGGISNQHIQSGAIVHGAKHATASDDGNPPPQSTFRASADGGATSPSSAAAIWSRLHFARTRRACSG